MDLKLNNSELNAILGMIDNAFGYGIEPLERATLTSIVNKINLNSRISNRCVEEFAVDILNTIYEEID